MLGLEAGRTIEPNTMLRDANSPRQDNFYDANLWDFLDQSDSLVALLLNFAIAETQLIILVSAKGHLPLFMKTTPNGYLFAQDQLLFPLH